MSPAVNARDSALALLARLQDRGIRVPLSSGLSNLDSALQGGIRPGLNLFGGVPGIGKTAFGLQVAMRSAVKAPGLYFTAEQHPDELIARILASEIDCPVSQLLDGDPTVIPEAIEAVDRLPLDKTYVVADERGKQGSVEGLSRLVEEIGAQHGEAPFVVVDYLQRLRSDQSHATTEVRVTVSRNSEELTNLIRDQGLTSLVISSLNRASYRAEPSLDAFKESGNLEFDADLAMVLCRHKSDDDEERPIFAPRASASVVELWIVKNRSGSLPVLPLLLAFDGRLGVFEPFPEAH